MMLNIIIDYKFRKIKEVTDNVAHVVWNYLDYSKYQYSIVVVYLGQIHVLSNYLNYSKYIYSIVVVYLGLIIHALSIFIF